MDNPWRHLPEHSPYILPSDAQAIASFNQRASDRHRIRTELLPEPYLGDPNAPIFLLNLNPGFSENDNLLLEDEYGKKISLDNLQHKTIAYPFFLLDPQVSYAPGAGWWRERLAAPIRAAGIEAVACRVCCVEYFPYHSRKYRNLGVTLESQRYGLHLVDRAINQNALIVVMRAKRMWFEHVPSLVAYHNIHICSNPRKPFISQGNLPEIYATIEQIIRR